MDEIKLSELLVDFLQKNYPLDFIAAIRNFDPLKTLFSIFYC